MLLPDCESWQACHADSIGFAYALTGAAVALRPSGRLGNRPVWCRDRDAPAGFSSDLTKRERQGMAPT